MKANQCGKTIVMPLFNNSGDVIDGTLVDVEDGEWLSSVNWYIGAGGYVTKGFYWYGKMVIFRMAHEIVTKHRIPQTGPIVDHINGDALDNRKCNLRWATVQENSYNRKMLANNTSGFKGVSFDNGKKGHRTLLKPWVAAMRIDGKSRHIGSFSSAVEAAVAYDDAVYASRGEFARLNFPDRTK